MPRKYFDQKLLSLNNSMNEMGMIVDSRIEQTIEALRTLNKEIAAEVVAGDNQIDEIEHEIEQV